MPVTYCYFDTETSLICPGLQSPPIVCVQQCIDEGPAQLLHVKDARPAIVWALENATLVGHNIAFDGAAICAQWPELTPAVFDAYAQDRVECTMLMARLVAIAKGEFKSLSGRKGSWALDGVASRFGVEIEINKEDPWRLRYGTLYSTPVEQWPEDARRYALTDAVAMREVHKGILAYASQRDIPLVDRFRQARGGFWLKLIESRGIKVDRARVEEYILEVEQEIATAEKVIRAAGLLRPNGTKDLKAARAWMERLCATIEIDPPKTDKGETALDKDAIDQYGDDVLEAYATFTSASTLRKRVAGLRTDVCIQSSYEPLIDTGRTSCRQGNGVSAHGAQLQNPPKKGGFRGCFIPRPGYYFSSADYASAEICTFGYSAIKKVGFSRMAEIVNKGGDVNTVTGAAFARITEAEGYARRRGEHGPELKAKFDSEARALGKVFNYGGLGGMGAAKLAVAARKQANLPLTLEQSKQYQRIWKTTYPEIPLMFDLANRTLDGKEYATTVHLKSGRMRGRLFYSQLLNSEFQPLASDIGRAAMFRISQECYSVKSSPLYGSRPVIWLHDESFLEVPIECAHEAAYRQAQIMVETAEEWCDGLIKWSAQPALMTRWTKAADTKLDASKRLIPWDIQEAA